LDKGEHDPFTVSFERNEHMNENTERTEEYTYQVETIRFIVTPVYKDKGEAVSDILLNLMMSELEPV